MHTAKYIEVEPSYKNCYIDIYFKTKTVVFICSKMLNPMPYFSKCSIQSYASLSVALANASKPQLP